MFKFLRKQKSIQSDKQILRKHQEEVGEFIAEHEYKMEHDPEYRQNLEKSIAFFQADCEAEKKAGLVNKLGSYTFICPNCGSECKGKWIRFDKFGSRHGHTGCYVCNIHLMV